jgi:hypothetical protein
MRATVAIRPIQAVFSSEVHGGQRVTFRGTFEQQDGHSFVAGAGAGFAGL